MSADHVIRLPRVGRHPPISGRDRRHFAREAQRAPQTYLDMMRQAEVKRAEGERCQREADRIECDAWCGALLFGLEGLMKSPTIAQAQNAGFDSVMILCRRCNRERKIMLADIHRPADTELWKLEASLSCQPCREDIEALKPNQRGLKTRTQAIITGLRRPYTPPDPEPSPTAARAGKV